MSFSFLFSNKELKIDAEIIKSPFPGKPKKDSITVQGFSRKQKSAVQIKTDKYGYPILFSLNLVRRLEVSIFRPALLARIKVSYSVVTAYQYKPINISPSIPYMSSMGIAVLSVNMTFRSYSSMRFIIPVCVIYAPPDFLLSGRK